MKFWTFTTLIILVLVATYLLFPPETDSYKLVFAETLPEGGKTEIEMLKDRPEVRFKKWNGEVDMGVSYAGVEAKAEKTSGDKVIWKNANNTSEEVHAYPIQAKAGLQDGGFEIEVVLNEKPNTNKFDFKIDGAEDLDFLYQPPLNEEYPDRGCSATECKFANHTTSRPENVVGSYAVYHKNKRDHILGQTNYGTGKAYHIYRPKAIDANGREQWAELHYENGILSVTVPQEFLNAASYPVIVDPTFGYTTAGASADGGGANWQYYLQLNDLSPAGNNTMTNISFFDNNGDGGSTVKLSLYNESADAPNARQFLDSGTVTIADGWNTNSTPYSYALSPSTQYWVGLEIVTTGMTVFWDTGGTKDVEGQTGNSPAIAASELEIATNARPSAYVTYTVDPPADSSNANVNIRGGGTPATANTPFVKIRGGSGGGGSGSVVYDNSSKASCDSGTCPFNGPNHELTFSHTTGSGSNRAIAVGCTVSGSSGTVQPNISM